MVWKFLRVLGKNVRHSIGIANDFDGTVEPGESDAAINLWQGGPDPEIAAAEAGQQQRNQHRDTRKEFPNHCVLPNRGAETRSSTAGLGALRRVRRRPIFPWTEERTAEE